jgi:hypothetical protein
VTTRTFCSAGDCITVTESTTHPGVIHIGTRHDGQPGRAQLTVTRGEWEAFVAGIKAEERTRWAPLLKRIYEATLEGGQSPTEARHRIINILDDAGAFGGTPFADLLEEPS